MKPGRDQSRHRQWAYQSDRLVLTKSLNPIDLGLNHVVVVFGYDLIGTDLTLHIYDPNFANNDAQTIRLGIADPLHTTTVTSNTEPAVD
jgi:hypothetical protein